MRPRATNEEHAELERRGGRAKSVTCNASFTLPEMLAVARPLQVSIDAEVKAGANPKGWVLGESVGNLNAKAIEALLDTRDYACARLPLRLGEAPSGKPRALIEHLCSDIGKRVCGVIWRLGEVGKDGVDATAGHWLGAAYEHSEKPLAKRR